jgi:hypothetical protein
MVPVKRNDDQHSPQVVAVVAATISSVELAMIESGTWPSRTCC